MKTFAKFAELPLAAVKPQGWLRQYLLNMRNGLTGHIEVAGFPFNSEGWLALGKYGVRGQDWGPYEQTGYWTDGAIRCGHLLGDKFLIRRAGQCVEQVLREQDRDGYLGPKFLKKLTSYSRWPHLVFFRAMMAQHLATGDKRIVQAMRKHYLSGTSDYSGERDVCNVEAILWTYARTGDKALLRLAGEVFAKHNSAFEKGGRFHGGAEIMYSRATLLDELLSDRRPHEHGVSYCEMGKLGAIMYMYTGNRRFLQASVNGFAKAERYSMLIDGVPSSSERLAGNTALDSHETCVIADYTWSMGYLLMATGEAKYADKIERACFNAAPGAVTADFKAIQYFSSPNQVIADRTSNHNYLFRGTTYMRFGPNPGTECCPGDVHRTMPNYAARMWLSDGQDGLVAALYGPSTITAKVGPSQAPVTIVEETEYPFGETITFKIQAKAPVEFALGLRIPTWCRRAKVLVNGQADKSAAKAGTFVTLRRKFADGDRIALELPMDVRVVKQGGGVAVERGPLVYALRIKEDWRVDPAQEGRSTKEFPAYNLYSASPWNYALALEGKDAAASVQVVRRRATDGNPWTPQGTPITLRVPARLVKGWDLLRQKSIIASRWFPGGFIEVGVKGDFRFTPPLPEKKGLAARLGKKLQTVTLVPYGCARMRIAIFPSCR